MPHRHDTATPDGDKVSPAAALVLADLAAPEAIGSGPWGKFAAEVTADGPARVFALLDQTGAPLLSAGQMLIESAGRLMLVTGAGEMVEAEGRAEGRCPPALPDGPVRAALGHLSPLRSLLPVVRGAMECRSATWRDGNGKAHVRTRILLLRPEAGPGAALVQVSALRGYGKAQEQVLAQLSPVTPVSAQALRERLALGPADLPSVPPGAEDAAFDLACDLIARNLAVAKERESGILADLDTEFLHDYRVALRRARSVLGLFKGVLADDLAQDLRARLAALMRVTGPLRDLDVFLLDRASSRALIPESLHRGLEAKFALMERQRRTARARLVRHLRSPAYGAEMAALAALFADRAALARGPRAEAPLSPFAGDLIARRYRRLCARAGQIGPDSPDAAVHALRIDGKKLRYLIEFFAPLFPPGPLRAVLLPLKALQDSLGVINDCAVQQVTLGRLLHAGGAADLDLAQSIGALIAMLHRRQADERQAALDRLAAFAAPRTRRQVRHLVRALWKEPG